MYCDYIYIIGPGFIFKPTRVKDKGLKRVKYSSFIFSPSIQSPTYNFCYYYYCYYYYYYYN